MNQDKATPTPNSAAMPREIPVEQLVEMLCLKIPISFRVGQAPKGQVEVVAYAGNDIRLIACCDANTACRWWLNEKIQRALCYLN